MTTGVRTNEVDQLGLLESCRLQGTAEAMQSFREQTRRELRAQGMPKQQANAESWRRAEAEYLPTLDCLFDTFHRPPSLLTENDLNLRWLRANRLAVVVCFVQSHYSCSCCTVIRATKSRLKVDPNSRELALNCLPECTESIQQFATSTAELFRVAAERIHEPGRLGIATRKELLGWAELLPELAAGEWISW